MSIVERILEKYPDYVSQDFVLLNDNMPEDLRNSIIQLKNFINQKASDYKAEETANLLLSYYESKQEKGSTIWKALVETFKDIPSGLHNIIYREVIRVPGRESQNARAAFVWEMAKHRLQSIRDLIAKVEHRQSQKEEKEYSVFTDPFEIMNKRLSIKYPRDWNDWIEYALEIRSRYVHLKLSESDLRGLYDNWATFLSKRYQRPSHELL